jgi:hypothetical protein
MIVYSRLVVLYVLMSNVPREFALAACFFIASFFTLYTSYFILRLFFSLLIHNTLFSLTKNKNY